MHFNLLFLLKAVFLEDKNALKFSKYAYINFYYPLLPPTLQT